MNTTTQFWRLIYINYVMARHRVDRIVFKTGPLSSLRFLSYLNPFNWRKQSQATRGESIRRALETLGPIFVKFGQALSTRRDLLPDDIVDELEKLQDQVPAFPGKEAVKIIENAYGQPLSTVFCTFDEEPLASASVAQVHRATLKNGKQVVVKVLRPGIAKTIKRDIALLNTVARILECVWSGSRRLKPVEVVKEFEHTLSDELDLVRESANASQLRRNFSGSDMLYVPEVDWSKTKKNVMVMEYISGIPVSDVATLKKTGIDLKALAERGVEIFFKQVFEHSFFHADMHPGNIFVSRENKSAPKYIAVDFGIMGILNPQDQRYLAENLLAFFKRDYRRVALLHVESGWVPSHVRVDQFESAIRTVCEPIFEKPLKDISFGRLLMNLFQTAGRFEMQVQPQLLLLQKTLLHIEGLGRQLYPELDLWQTGKPFLEGWVRQQLGPKQIMKKLYQQAPRWAERFVDMPDLLHSFLKNPTPTVVTKIVRKRFSWISFAFGVVLTVAFFWLYLE